MIDEIDLLFEAVHEEETQWFTTVQNSSIMMMRAEYEYLLKTAWEDSD